LKSPADFRGRPGTLQACARNAPIALHRTPAYAVRLEKELVSQAPSGARLKRVRQRTRSGRDGRRPPALSACRRKCSRLPIRLLGPGLHRNRAGPCMAASSLVATHHIHSCGAWFGYIPIPHSPNFSPRTWAEGDTALRHRADRNRCTMGSFPVGISS
jgi:hypothetical protein